MDIAPESTNDIPEGMDPSSLPMTPEHRAEIEQLMLKVKEGLGKWNSTRFAVDNSIESSRNDQVRQVFHMLMQTGVDLKDPASVSEFLQQLKTEAPDKYEIVAKALDELLGTNYENTPATASESGELPQGPQETVFPPEGI